MKNTNEIKKNRKGLLGIILAAVICTTSIIPAFATTTKASAPQMNNAVEGVFETISVNTINGAKEIKDDEITATVQTAVAENRIANIAALGLISFGG